MNVDETTSKSRGGRASVEMTDPMETGSWRRKASVRSRSGRNGVRIGRVGPSTTEQPEIVHGLLTKTVVRKEKAVR